MARPARDNLLRFVAQAALVRQGRQARRARREVGSPSLQAVQGQACLRHDLHLLTLELQHDHQRITLTLKSPIEASPGKSLERTERYEYEPAKFGLSVYPMQPTKDPEVWVRSNMSYGNVESIIAFAAYRQKENDAAAAQASKHIVEERARNVRKAEAAFVVDEIRKAFKLDQFHWEYRVWAEVGEEVGGRLPAFCGVELCIVKEPARHLALRKLLKPLLTDAKASAREEYPDDYKEEEDKDDFYETYIDEIARSIIANID
jgi:hypothetical protein